MSRPALADDTLEAAAAAYAASSAALAGAVVQVTADLSVPPGHAMQILAEAVLIAFASVDRDRAVALSEAMTRQLKALPADVEAYRRAQAEVRETMHELQRLLALNAAGPGN